MPNTLPSGVARIDAAGVDAHDDVMPVSGQPGWRLECPPAGGRLILQASEAGAIGGAWSQERHLTISVYQDTEHSLFYRIAIRSGAETDAQRTSAEFDFGIFPGLEVPATLPLHYLDMQTLFLPRTPGRLKSNAWGSPVVPEEVTTLELILPPSLGPQTVWVSWPQVTNKEPSYDLVRNAPPVVDSLGQWKRKAWASKTANEEELVRNLRAWRDEDLLPQEGPFDIYGGWTGSLQPTNLQHETTTQEQQSAATGFFRVEHEGDRWWLVDPLGHPFFSAGVDCVGYDVASPFADLEGLYDWLPPREGLWESAWRGRFLCFSTANLIRAFGETWMQDWAALTAKRMRHWGFNTVATWSFPGFGRIVGIPYVMIMPKFPTTRQRVFRDFPDVFSPEYAESAAECAQGLAETADDPYLIGYFLTNEPHWAFGPYNLAEILLSLDAPLASRDTLIAFLRERYEDDPARFAAAWNLPIAGFEDLRSPIENAAELSETAAKDLADFNALLVAEYVRVPSEAARRVDPNHLNLGLRWAWIAQDFFYAGSEHCDVFSINHYQLQPDPAAIESVYRKSKRPVIIGEFHAGALDVGLPSNALRGVPSQHERGVFYRSYMEKAAAIPWLLGAHYFQWMDQPVLGRFDGECCNLGLIDICQKPYADMIAEARIANARLAPIHAGVIEPTTDVPVEVPKEGF